MGWQLAAYRAASHALPLIAPALLRKRLKKGKEDPARWREKLGEASQPRPEGPLIWLHAVGLGEVLALRGLIQSLAKIRPDLNFLVTSSARSSAQALQGQMPPKTLHQFLPVDAPQYLSRFLAHWRPDLSIWAEQDLWPGAVFAADQAGVPLALVNARMNAKAFASRAKLRGLYGDLLGRFRLIAAQEAQTAAHLTALGAKGVMVTGSLKAASPPLVADARAVEGLAGALAGRQPWLLASSHLGDEALAMAAISPERLLLIAPRDPQRGAEIAGLARDKGLICHRRSLGEGPEGADVWLVDSFGEMGLWYRLCPTTLIGGTFSEIEGHNPWEPAALGSAILHGPRTANFAADFAALDGAEAALALSPEQLKAALTLDLSAQAAKAKSLSQEAQDRLMPLAQDLLELLA